MHTKSWFWLLVGPFSPLSLLSLGLRGTLGFFTLWAISPAGEIGSSKVPLESSVCIHRYRVLTGELKHPWILVSEAVPTTNSHRCGGVNAYHVRCIYWPTHSPDSKRETQHLSMRRVVKSQGKDLYRLSEAAEDLQTVSLTG